MNKKFEKSFRRGIRASLEKKSAVSPWLAGGLGLGLGALGGHYVPKLIDKIRGEDKSKYQLTDQSSSPYVQEQEVSMSPEEYYQLLALYNQPQYY